MSNDSDDDDEAEIGEICKAVVDRVVRRIRGACEKLGVGKEVSFVEEKDVVR